MVLKTWISDEVTRHVSPPGSAEVAGIEISNKSSFWVQKGNTTTTHPPWIYSEIIKMMQPLDKQNHIFPHSSLFWGRSLAISLFHPCSCPPFLSTKPVCLLRTKGRFRVNTDILQPCGKCGDTKLGSKGSFVVHLCLCLQQFMNWCFRLTCHLQLSSYDIWWPPSKNRRMYKWYSWVSEKNEIEFKPCWSYHCQKKRNDSMGMVISLMFTSTCTLDLLCVFALKNCVFCLCIKLKSLILWRGGNKKWIRFVRKKKMQ